MWRCRETPPIAFSSTLPPFLLQSGEWTKQRPGTQQVRGVAFGSRPRVQGSLQPPLPRQKLFKGSKLLPVGSRPPSPGPFRLLRLHLAHGSGKLGPPVPGGLPAGLLLASLFMLDQPGFFLHQGVYKQRLHLLAAVATSAPSRKGGVRWGVGSRQGPRYLLHTEAVQELPGEGPSVLLSCAALGPCGSDVAKRLPLHSVAAAGS